MGGGFYPPPSVCSGLENSCGTLLAVLGLEFHREKDVQDLLESTPGFEKQVKTMDQWQTAQEVPMEEAFTRLRKGKA